MLDIMGTLKVDSTELKRNKMRRTNLTELPNNSLHVLISLLLVSVRFAWKLELDEGKSSWIFMAF